MVRKTFCLIGAITLIVLLSATVFAKDLMAKSDRPITPKPDQALIVFIRPHPGVGRAMFTGDSGEKVAIYDVSNTSNENKFIGILKIGTKICYDVSPGQSTFMVISESADFMKTDLAAGKTYYAVLLPRFGAWKARFSFRPLRHSDLTSEEFTEWDSNSYLIDNTPESGKWAAKNTAKVEKMRAGYWQEWTELSPEIQDSMTLKPEDGR